MDNSWVKIYTSNQFIKSEIVRQVLVDHEMNAVLMNKQDTAYKFGEVEVYIHQDNFDQALEIIIQNDL
jgi:hypothetical protein